MQARDIILSARGRDICELRSLCDGRGTPNNLHQLVFVYIRKLQHRKQICLHIQMEVKRCCFVVKTAR